MNIAELISGGIGSTVTSTVARTLNIEEGKAKWVVSAAVPLMIAALNYNAQNKNQEANINQALDQHAGGIFGNLAGAIAGGPSNDGTKIVNHIFGKNTGFVEQNLSQKSGLSTGQISSLLAILAPVVMGFLGQNRQQAQGAGGIGDLIGGLLGGGQQASAGGGLLGGLLGGLFGGGQQAAPQQAGGMGMLADLAGEFFSQKQNPNQGANVLDSLAGLFGR